MKERKQADNWGYIITVVLLILCVLMAVLGISSCNTSKNYSAYQKSNEVVIVGSFIDDTSTRTSKILCDSNGVLFRHVQRTNKLYTTAELTTESQNIINRLTCDTPLH